jgi:hypothetical protein
MIGEDDIPYATVVRKSSSGGTKVRKRVEEAFEEAFEDEDKASARKTLFSMQNASRILFSDRVLLMEGKAEKRLIPRLYEKVSGQTLREAKIGLVGVHGAGIIPKCFEILSTMNMNVGALVDLDFVFGHAANKGLLEEDDEHLQVCKQIHDDDAEVLHSETGAKQLVESGDADTEIQHLHEKMREQSYWVWPGGALEAHLGIDGKNESTWADFKDELEEDGFEQAVSEPESVQQLIEWIDG